MKIQESLLLASIASVVGFSAAVQAAPLVSIGDNVDVFFNGSSSVQWQSNVFYDEHDEQDDYKLTVSPGFEVNIGRGLSNLDLSIITRYDIIRYDDLTNLDDELFHFKVIGSYKTSRWDLNGSVGYDQEQSASGAEGGTGKGRMVHSDNTHANLEGEYRLSPKFSVGSGVRYTYKDNTNDDQLVGDETYTVPLDVFYELTPKVDLSVGYTYSNTEVGKSESFDGVNGYSSSSYDKQGNFFNVGLRGDLLPKLTGFFKVGYRTTDADDSTFRSYPSGAETTRKGDSDGTMGFDGNFTYLATPKVTTTLAIHRGFGFGGEGQSTVNTSGRLSASYSINTNYSASANFGYTLREYEDGDNREDNVYNTGVSLSYVPNQYWRFSTGYNYSHNDSNRDDQSYKAHMLNLSASLRY